MIKYVYVAGPYTKPNPAHNVWRAVQAADALLALDFVPYVPHISQLWDTISPKDYETWMKLDFAFIERCDAVLRLSGESPGADREVIRAKELGIPVANSIAELRAFADQSRDLWRPCAPCAKKGRTASECERVHRA